VTPPTWLDAYGRRRPRLTCWDVRSRGRAAATQGRASAATRLAPCSRWTPPLTSRVRARG